MQPIKCSGLISNAPDLRGHQIWQVRSFAVPLLPHTSFVAHFYFATCFHKTGIWFYCTWSTLINTLNIYIKFKNQTELWHWIVTAYACTVSCDYSFSANFNTSGVLPYHRSSFSFVKFGLYLNIWKSCFALGAAEWLLKTTGCA